MYFLVLYSFDFFYNCLNSILLLYFAKFDEMGQCIMIFLGCSVLPLFHNQNLVVSLCREIIFRSNITLFLVGCFDDASLSDLIIKLV